MFCCRDTCTLETVRSRMAQSMLIPFLLQLYSRYPSFSSFSYSCFLVHYSYLFFLSPLGPRVTLHRCIRRLHKKPQGISLTFLLTTNPSFRSPPSLPYPLLFQLYLFLVTLLSSIILVLMLTVTTPSLFWLATMFAILGNVLYATVNVFYNALLISMFSLFSSLLPSSASPIILVIGDVKRTWNGVRNIVNIFIYALKLIIQFFSSFCFYHLLMILIRCGFS